MNRRVMLFGAGVVVIGLVVVAVVVVYPLLAGGSGEASAPISAPDLTPQSVGATVFQIVPEESEVRFILTEDLFGQPTTVIGSTNQVTGEIAVDTVNPSNSQVGTIIVNARTLTTDNEFRNRAIRTYILESARDEFEFSQFTPTAIQGLPESVTNLALGQAVTFQITGDLTVRNITSSVTFDVTVTPVSETRLEGSAAATVQRSSFELTIPNVPNVANVSEEVRLEIDFVAVAVGQDQESES